jgi:hypothetical protein
MFKQQTGSEKMLRGAVFFAADQKVPKKCYVLFERLLSLWFVFLRTILDADYIDFHHELCYDLSLATGW